MAKWPYDTPNWKKLRALKLAAEPMCEECRAEGKRVVANVVDHRIAISQGGHPFPALEGLASLCVRHHSMKTARGPEAGAAKRTRPRSACDPDGKPLDRHHPWNADPDIAAGMVRARPRDLRPPLCETVLICGSPGSGKSTYAAGAAQEHDIVLDLDLIIAELSGAPIYQAEGDWLSQALQARNRRLQQLANVRPNGRLFLIVGAPTADERDWWATGLRAARTIVLLPGRDACVARIRADGRRGALKQKHIEAAYRWHARFTPRDDDDVVGVDGKSLGAGVPIPRPAPNI